MSLTPEQSSAVSSWIAAGDNLSVVQKKLREQFNLALTYMDVRFLVDDLNLALKDPAPKVDTSDVSKAQPKPAAASAPARKPAPPAAASVPPADDAALADDEDAAFADEADALPPEADDAPAGTGSVSVELDAVTLLPGAIASGSVTFSDGVTGKWIVDQYGRPGFTEISQPGYRPNPTDAQAFMTQLSAALQKKGF